MIGWPATERNNGKIELDPISTEERPRQLLAVYGCKERNFLLQNNGILQRNNGETATEERQRNGGNRA